MRWEGYLERVKNQPSRPTATLRLQPTWDALISSLRNWRTHKFWALWYHCVKYKIQLFLGTFKEMSPRLLKWCNQNQRPHHASWAKQKRECTELHPEGMFYLQHPCAEKNKGMGGRGVEGGAFVFVYGKRSLLKTARRSLLMNKEAWLTQNPSWDSKHDFFSKS